MTEAYAEPKRHVGLRALAAELGRSEASIEGKAFHLGLTQPLRVKGAVPRTLAERFWPKVDKAGPTVRPELGPCWVWTAAKYPNGYGMIGRGGRGSGVEGAHRVAVLLEHGSLPEVAMHACDNPACVKAVADAFPAHVIAGTAKDNTHDMIAKGRAAPQVVHGFQRRTETRCVES